MNIQDRNSIPDINQLPTVVRAYWECIHALTNTYEYQKKSAQEQALWIKKNEEEKIENLIASFLADMEEKEKREILLEEIERYYNQLKKILESSGDIILSGGYDDINLKDVELMHNLLTMIKNCEAQMIILWQKITELNDKRENMCQKIEEFNYRLKEIDDEISIIRQQKKMLAQEREQLLEEFFPDRGEISKFDLSKLQSDDADFMEIISRGIKIIDINHGLIMGKLKNNFADKVVDRDAIERVVDEFAGSIIMEIINANYVNLTTSNEKRKDFSKNVENCDYYKMEVARVSENIMREVGQNKVKNALNENKSNQNNLNDVEKINEKEEVIRKKDQQILAFEDINSEHEKAQEEFRKKAEQREAFLKRLNQMKSAKKQLEVQPLSNTEINRMVDSKQLKDCESVVVSTPPTRESLDKLPITSDAAYVLCDSNKQLYFINKDTRECRNLGLPKEAVEKLTNSVPSSLECQKLSENHLMKIGVMLRGNAKQDSKLEESAEHRKDKDKGHSKEGRAQNDSHFEPKVGR